LNKKWKQFKTGNVHIYWMQHRMVAILLALSQTTTYDAKKQEKTNNLINISKNKFSYKFAKN